MPDEQLTQPMAGPEGDGTLQPNEPDVAVVAVGASAGGLEAFTELLRHLPTDTGLAFVLIQHLAPRHDSMLAQRKRLVIHRRAGAAAVVAAADFAAQA